jgi:hypothetical protein
MPRTNSTRRNGQLSSKRHGARAAVRYEETGSPVRKVYPELIRDEKGTIQGVRYEELAAMLLNENAEGRGTQFEFRRQGDPQLEAARPTYLVEPAAVPHAAPRRHPFHTAGA